MQTIPITPAPREAAILPPLKLKPLREVLSPEQYAADFLTFILCVTLNDDALIPFSAIRLWFDTQAHLAAGESRRSLARRRLDKALAVVVAAYCSQYPDLDPDQIRVSLLATPMRSVQLAQGE